MKEEHIKRLPEELQKWYDPKYCLDQVKYNECNIQYIDNPSEELQLIAVRQTGWTIQFIDNPSIAVCLEAVKQNRDSLGLIHHLSDTDMDKLLKSINL